MSCSEGFKKNNTEEGKYVLVNKYLNLAQDDELDKTYRIKCSDSAFLELIKLDNDSLNRRSFFKVANRYYSLYELEKYHEVSKKVLYLSIESNDSLSVARAQYYIGDYFFEKTKNDSAYYFYTKAEKTYLSVKSEMDLANTILHKAYILLYEKDYLGSEITTIKALNFSEKHKDNLVKYQCYVNLGSSLLGLNNFEKALEYHNKALHQIEKLKNEACYEIFKAQTHNNIGLVYLKNNKYTEAKLSFVKGLQIKNIEKTQPLLYASLLDNLAYTKFKTNDFTAFNDFDESLKLRDSLGNLPGIVKSKIHLTEYFLSIKNPNKAFQLNYEAYKIAKDAKFHGEVLQALDLLSKTDVENGLAYSNEYIKLNDSLYSSERETRNKLARIEFETDEIIHEKEILSEQNKLIFVISLIVVSFGILLYIILYLRSKQKELIFAQEQQSANEEIYKLMINQQIKVDEVRNIEKNRIAKELHDGIMNKLTSTRLNLFVLSRRRDEETIQNCIGYINDIQNIEKEVRLIAHELNNDIFAQKNSFKSILKELFEDQNKLFSAKCEFEADKKINWEKIDVSVKMNLYRIIQEALNNCNKYASASKVYIQIYKDEAENITLSIKDNGAGFNSNKKKNGIGMKNMSERAASIGGTFRINSEINQGTTILIEFTVI